MTGNTGIFRVLPREDRGAGDIAISGMTLRNPGRSGNANVTFGVSIAAQRATTTIGAIRLDDLDVRANVLSPPVPAPDPPVPPPSYGVYADSAGEGRVAPALEITDSRFTEHSLNAIGVDGWRGDVTIDGNDLREGTRGNSSLLVFNEYAAARITQPVVVRGNTSAGRLIDMRNITVNATVRSRGAFDDVTISDNLVTALTDQDWAIRVGTVPQLDPTDGNDAIKMGEIDITGNVVRGDGTSAGTSGVQIVGQVEDATITGNDVVGVGAGVAVRTDGASTGALGPDTVVVRENRLFANERGVDNSSAATVDAARNWWGCQTDPAEPSDFCSEARTTGGPVTTAPWVVVTAGIDDDEVEVGADSGLEVTLDTLSDGQPADLPAIFTGLLTGWSAERGSVDPATGELDAASSDSASYTAPATEGPDTVTVFVDEEQFAGLADSSASAQPAGFGDPVVRGEPLTLEIGVVAAAEVPGGSDAGGDAGGEGAGGDGSPGAGSRAPDHVSADGRSLPGGGSPTSLGLVALAALSLTAGAALARRGRARDGAHRA